MDISTREPELFAIGDTLLFQRYLPDYQPADGWHIHYVVTDQTGTEKIALDTVPNPQDNTRHLAQINNFAAGIAPGDYIFTGQLVNASGEKHQIYYETITLQPDLADGAGTGTDLETEAQQMIRILRASLADLYAKQFQETDVQRNKFILQKQGEVLQQLQFWKEARVNEIQVERARAGRPIGNVTVPIFAVGL